MSEEPPPPEIVPPLEEADKARAEERIALRPQVVHEAIRREGELELERTTSALAWSGLAAGLSMGFILVAEGLLAARLPDAPWAHLVSRLGYCVGFLLVILARQQLFTENTLTVILPLLSRRTRRVLLHVLRLWGVVLCTNLMGALLFALVIARTDVFGPELRATFRALSVGVVLRGGVSTVFLRAVFAGWLIALMVWMLPAAESSRVFVVTVVSYLVGVADLTHVIASSVEAFYALWVGAVTPGRVVVFLGAALIGNIVGGVSLVAALNHAQVVAGAHAKADRA